MERKTPFWNLVSAKLLALDFSDLMGQVIFPQVYWFAPHPQASGTAECRCIAENDARHGNTNPIGF